MPQAFAPLLPPAEWTRRADLAALIAASAGAGYEPGFLEAVQDANARFRAALTGV